MSRTSGRKLGPPY